MSLIEEVNVRRKEIRTDGYPMSIGEWLSLYESKEIDIHPEFQRFFRWSSEQKTALIESILLGIPIPPIFVSQREDGVWDVVDGLQRLSTIYQFAGVLRDETDKLIDPLVLSETKYLPSLADKVWDGEDESSIGSDLRLVVKRSKINVSIILRESDSSSKYELFQRLNTGGSQLSEQEVRNCILVMVNADFYRWLRDLANNVDFQTTITLSDRLLNEAYDIELALRFIIFSLMPVEEFSNIGDVGVYLTERMTAVAEDKQFDKARFSKVFTETFRMLNESLGDRAFKRFDAGKGRFLGGFLVSAYEAVAYGLAYNVDRNIAVADIEQRTKDLWVQQEFINWTGSGITATRRLPRILPVGRGIFS